MKIMIAVLIVLSCCALAVADDNAREYQNPVAASNDVPTGPASAVKGKLRLAKVVSLTPQDEMTRYTTDDEVDKFFKVIETKVITTSNRYAKVKPLVIQFDCIPNAYKFKITSKGMPSEKLLDDVSDDLSDMPALKTTGPVSFQAEFDTTH